MKKGVASTIVAIMIFIIVMTIMTSLGLTWAWGKGLTTTSTIQLGVYGMKNALGAADIYMDTAMDYSVWQALYDTARQGGYCEVPGTSATIAGMDYSYWYVDGEETVPDDETALRNIETCTLANINAYTADWYTFMDSYDVVLPTIQAQQDPEFPGTPSVFQCQREGNAIGFSLDSELTITDSNPEQKTDIFLKKNINMDKTYEPGYFELVAKAREKVAVYAASFLEAIQQEIAKWPEHGELSGQGISFDDIFSAMVSDEGLPVQTSMAEAEEYFKDLFSLESYSALNFEVTEEGYTIKSTVVAADADIKTTSSCLVVDGEGTCDFEYAAGAIIKVEISKTGAEQLPVYNGYRIGFEPLTFSFLIEVKEGEVGIMIGEEPVDYDSIILQAAGEFGIDADLIKAFIRLESNFNPRAVSPDCGAVGLMQLMPGTALETPYIEKTYGSVAYTSCNPAHSQTMEELAETSSLEELKALDDRFDGEKNIMAGTYYLKTLMDRFGSTQLAIAAYYAGPTAVSSCNCVPSVAQNYVDTITEYYKQYSAQA